MHPRVIRKRILLFTQIALAIGLLALLWQVFEGNLALDLLATSNFLLLLLSFATLNLQTVFSALRWRLTARELGFTMSFQTALREYYLAQVGNQLLPGGVLGDAGRVFRSTGSGGLVVSAQAVFLERAAGQIALVGLLVSSLFVSAWFPFGVEFPSWLVITLWLLILVFFLILLLLALLARKTKGRIASQLLSLGKAAKTAFGAPKVRWAQAALSLGTAFCNVAAFSFAAWAVGAELSLLQAMAIVPLILLAMALPLTVGGWGLREGAAVALLPLAQVTAAESLAASVGFGIVLLISALPGLAFAGRTPKQTHSAGLMDRDGQ